MGRRRASFARGVQSRDACSVRTATSRPARRSRGSSSIASCSAITGEAAYAEEIERSAYNDLLGAQAPNGEDWCYYSFPNGRRVHTTYWRCCKSSGAMALEELPSLAYGVAARTACA